MPSQARVKKNVVFIDLYESLAIICYGCRIEEGKIAIYLLVIHSKFYHLFYLNSTVCTWALGVFEFSLIYAVLG